MNEKQENGKVMALLEADLLAAQTELKRLQEIARGIEWVAYESMLPGSHVWYLVSGGFWVSLGVHQLDIKDRVYRWFGTDGEPIAGITHFARINYPNQEGQTNVADK